MPTANSSPGTLGLYINSYKRGSSSSPYKDLLGDPTLDGTGNYSGGNKLTDLYNYTSQYGYNYGLYYDLHTNSFVGSNKEVYINATPGYGKLLLDILNPLAHAAGIVERSAVISVYSPDNTIPGAGFNGYDGIAHVMRNVNYNAYTGNDVTKIFTHVSCETEFWNFKYNATTALPSTVRLVNNGTTGEVRSNTPGAIDFTTLGLSIKQFIVVNNQWRQIVQISTNIILVDRNWDTTSINQPWRSYTNHGDETVDYETYLHRITKCINYINLMGSSILIDLYVGHPSYTFRGTLPSGYPLQFTKLYDAGVSRINFTAYQRIPSFDSGNPQACLDNDYGDAPSGGYRRISDDVISSGVSRDIGCIISMESSTFNNDGCAFNTNTNNNFTGYMAEGRSVLPHSVSTDFKALDAGGVTSTCVCCPTGLSYTKPDVTYNPLSLDEIWRYIAETPPSGGVCPTCYPVTLADTFNEVIAAGGTRGTNLDNYINFDTLIVFDQEFIRQLNITPAVAMSLSVTGTNVTCNGADNGTATVGVIGGVAPFTYLWDDPGASTTASITGLAPGTYTCTVTDDAATVDSISITITEPAAVTFTATVTNADCAGNNGQIAITSPTGTPPYLYSVVPTGNPKIWTGTATRTGLTAGVYDVSVSSGDPANGCITTVQRTISAGASFTISQAHTNITCNGGINGSITLTPSTPGTYTYNLYASAVLIQSNSIGVFNNLVAGTYTASAKNSLDCTSNTLSITVTEPSEVVLTTVEIVNPDCNSASNGSIEVSGSGGTGPYSYTITYPTGITISNSSGIFLNLHSGTYSIYAEDASGCTSNISFLTVNDPNPIVVSYSVTQPIAGFSTTGSITLESISGGTAPIEYLWSTGATTSSLSDLSPGEYSVIITDNNGCNITRTFIIRLECDSFSLEEMKILAYKAQCCAGDLAVKYVKAVREGREDKTEKLLNDLRTLTMIVDTFYCTQEPGSESRLTCEEMQHLIDLVNNICDCDCCKDPNYQTINVTYDSDSGSINQI